MELERERSLLKAIAGVTSVNFYDYNKAGAQDQNKIGVKCKAPESAEAGAAKNWINVHCSAEFSEQLNCAREVRRRVRDILGEAAILAAEEIVVQNTSGAGPSSSPPTAPPSAPRTALGAVMQTQQLEAALRTAQRRLDTLEHEYKTAHAAATCEVSEATAALEEHQASLRTKRQRTADAEQQATKEAAAAAKAAVEAAKAAVEAANAAEYATHLKSSGNLHYWSNKQDELKLGDFIETIMIEYGCPGKGKGPWDGVGAAIKTKVRNDIINEIMKKAKTTPSGKITNALEVAQHLRAIFSS
jgi:flagellar biosynthesis GTPase FlhF